MDVAESLWKNTNALGKWLKQGPLGGQFASLHVRNGRHWAQTILRFERIPVKTIGWRNIGVCFNRLIFQFVFACQNSASPVQVLLLWDNSQAYGRFREEGLQEKLAGSGHPWVRLRVTGGDDDN